MMLIFIDVCLRWQIITGVVMDVTGVNEDQEDKEEASPADTEMASWSVWKQLSPSNLWREGKAQFPMCAGLVIIIRLLHDMREWSPNLIPANTKHLYNIYTMLVLPMLINS